MRANRFAELRGHQHHTDINLEPFGDDLALLDVIATSAPTDSPVSLTTEAPIAPITDSPTDFANTGEPTGAPTMSPTGSPVATATDSPTGAPTFSTEAPTPEPLPNLVHVADSTETLSTFLGLLDSTGVYGLLEGETTYTLFGPIDSAWPQGESLDFFLGVQDAESLEAIVKYHIVPGMISPFDSRAMETENTGYPCMKFVVPSRGSMIQR